MTPDIYLTRNEQNRIRSMLQPVGTVSEYLGKAAESLREGEGWTKALVESNTWLKDVTGAVASTVPILGIAVKLAEKWLEQTHPYELGAVACTLAYQDAVRHSIGAHWTRASNWPEAVTIGARAAKQIRELAPAEEADLSSFRPDTAMQHPFLKRADQIVSALLTASGCDTEQQREILNEIHENFLEKLRLLLADKTTAARFAPFKDWMELDDGRQAALAALQVHARYQRDQYLAEPLFKREPYALAHVYIDTECGKLTWREIRGRRDGAYEASGDDAGSRCDPFSESHGGRHDLLDTVLGYVKDHEFREAIVIQGVAGAGKSSFTLRLAAKLWEEGFHPLRVRLKRLRLSSSLLDALNEAIELGDADKIDELPIAREKDILLGGDVFRTPYGGDRSICRYVLILDGWDELDLSDNKTFREKVADMLREVRRFFLDPQRSPRVRVIVTGRPSNDVAESKFLNDATPVLTMRPIRPEQLRMLVSRLDDALRATPPLIAVKSAESWSVPSEASLRRLFERYEHDFQANLPTRNAAARMAKAEASSTGSLEVLGLPLLSYLTLRVMARQVEHGGSLEQQQGIIAELVENPTVLYRSLLDLTCEKAGKAAFDDRDTTDEVALQPREIGLKLRERLQRTAAAISVLGVEYISSREWERRVLHDKKDRLRGKLETAEDHPLTKLMISFYFKGGRPEQGCEFVHKSFREYLFAECIVEVLKASSRDILEPPQPPRRDYWRDFSAAEDRVHHRLSRALSALLAPQWLKPEVKRHLEYLLEWEIARARRTASTDGSRDVDSNLSAHSHPTPEISLERWTWIRDVLADLWQWWCDGAHLRPQVYQPEGEDSKVEPAYVHKLVLEAAAKGRPKEETLELEPAYSMDAHLGDGLCQICALVHADLARVDISSWDEWQALKLVREGVGRHHQQIVEAAKHRLVLFAPGARTSLGPDFQPDAFQRAAARVNAAPGRPVREFPSGTSLGFCSLAGTRLDRARFDGASLDGVRFDGARLDGARLYGARLDGAILDGANLDTASFYGAILDGARFNHATLNSASLYGANLNRASFYGASLKRASLNSTSLHGANLDGASLEGASLHDALLDGASLYGTNLDSARILGADLSRAVNLTQSQSERAIMDQTTRLPPELEAERSALLTIQREHAVKALENRGRTPS